jgi:hypothetical protein
MTVVVAHSFFFPDSDLTNRVFFFRYEFNTLDNYPSGRARPKAKHVEMFQICNFVHKARQAQCKRQISR